MRPPTVTLRRSAAIVESCQRSMELLEAGEGGFESAADGVADLVVERAHVRLDQCCGTVAVAVDQRGVDLAVLVDHVIEVGDVGEVEVPQPVALRVEHVERVGEEAIVGGLPHDLAAPRSISSSSSA